MTTYKIEGDKVNKGILPIVCMETLPLNESIKIAEKYGIRFAETLVCRNESEMERSCRRIGFPVAMKVISGKISHKSESGGVKINIQTLEQAKESFIKMKRLAGFAGVIVQQMAGGIEIIIGGVRDLQFGPCVLFGSGGIYAEVFKDVSLRICPVGRKTALEMVKSIKSYPILAGARGKEGANISKIADAITKVSSLMMKEKNIQELDINPLMATKSGVVAVDARIILG